MKKILYVTTIATTVNAFLVPHIKYLIKKGYNVDIATNIDVHINQELLDLGVNVFQIPFQRNPLSKINKKAYEEIKKLQQEEKYDIVHVHTPVASFLTRLALKDSSNLKMVYTCHGFHFYKGSSPINWLLFYPLEKLAAKYTDHIITINSEDFEVAKRFKLKNNGGVSKINGVGIESEKYIIKDFDKYKYREKLGLDKDDFVILVLAELNKNKNHIQLIKAMSILKNKYPNIKAIFAGQGPLESKIKEEINKHNLSDNIMLLGWRDDVKELLNCCDIVGLFSKREGLGKCLLEGMICGKTVIATNTRGPRELILNNENGFLIEINDYEKTSSAIEKIYLDENLRKQFETQCKKKSSEYLLDNVLCQLEEIYESISNKENELVGVLR